MSLLASLNCSGEVNLLIGVSGLTYTRVESILANDARAIVITNEDDVDIPYGLRKLEEEKKVEIVRRGFDLEKDLMTFGRVKVGGIVDRVFVNLSAQYESLKYQIFEKCQIYRIPINTTESPELSSFTLLSTYSDGDFKLGITTSGKGCKLANRIKREIVSQLPKHLGQVCSNVGALRLRIKEEDNEKLRELYQSDYEQITKMIELGEDEEDSVQSSRFNSFVSEFNMSEAQRKLQRSRWLSQIVEYYPFEKLATISIDDLSTSYKDSQNSNDEQAKKKVKLDNSQDITSQESSQSNSGPIVTTESKKTPSASCKGSISLVGSGPGSVSMLTIGALHEINTADIVLADKLVPQQVLDLIPQKTAKFIARKFPGNAEAAQEELLSLGLKSLQEGKKVVRLKQGDPYIFGRGGEEYLYFQEHGYEPTVLPGITSALSSTVSSKIPATQRDVADQVLICTGTGRRGVLPNIPEFVETRTTVFLMSLHRIKDLVDALISKKWDPELPAAIVERSTCPDQRVTRTRLKDLVETVEAIGSRPPGLLVLGRAVDVLSGKLGGEEKWSIEEGFEATAVPLGNYVI